MGSPRNLVSVHPHAADSLTYETFFGLAEKPFSLNADPRFLYHSPSHALTFENLLAGIRRREGLLVLTGEIGTGKTLLCRAVLRSLGRQTYSSFVPDPFASREDLLKMLLIDFGVLSIEDFTIGALKQASRTELSYMLAAFLESLPPLEAFVVVIIDEAQNMSLPLIEEARILADSFCSKGHLQIVFVGQPQLHTKLKLPEMRQVDQRVCGYNCLTPLGRDAVAGYIEHRLHVAGLSRDRVLFAPEVIDILHRRSGGVPRLINRICDRALHLAHLRQAPHVDREILETALIEKGPATLTPTCDSIVSPQPEVAAPPTASTAPPADEDENFSQLVDTWVMQELPKSRTLRRRPDVAAEAPAPQARAPRHSIVKRAVASPSARSSPQGELRSQSYLQRLGRVWMRRVAIAAVCFAALSAVVVGASLVPGVLENGMSSPNLPALPAPPATAVLDIAPPALPAIEPIQASRPTAAGDYLIVVGLFTDRAGADRLVAELAQAGLPAMQRPFQLRRQRVQQVVLGPFAKRSDVIENLRRLRQLGAHDDANVVVAPSGTYQRNGK